MERRKPFMQNVKKGGPNTIFDIKVMICYILNTLKSPISAENLSTVVVTQELVNYFEYQSALGELLDGGHIERFSNDDGEEFYRISENGAALVVDLESSLSPTLRSYAIRTAMQVLTFKQNEKENTVTVTRAKEGGYLLSVEIPGTPEPLCSFTLYFPERLQAEKARDGFLENPTLAYTSLLCALTGDRTTLLTALSDKVGGF